VVGLIVGWSAGQIVQGTKFGIVGDLIIGVVGAFIGGWLLPQLGAQLGWGIVRYGQSTTPLARWRSSLSLSSFAVEADREAAGEAADGERVGAGAGNIEQVLHGELFLEIRRGPNRRAPRSGATSLDWLKRKRICVAQFGLSGRSTARGFDGV
jgi:hypothetical protein